MLKVMKIPFFAILVWNSISIAYLFFRVWKGNGQHIMQETNSLILLTEVICSAIVAIVGIIILLIKLKKAWRD